MIRFIISIIICHLTFSCCYAQKKLPNCNSVKDSCYRIGVTPQDLSKGYLVTDLVFKVNGLQPFTRCQVKSMHDLILVESYEFKGDSLYIRYGIDFGQRALYKLNMGVLSDETDVTTFSFNGEARSIRLCIEAIPLKK